jgi:putative transcriptional regulator
MKSLQGQLLVASPKLVDPNFFRSVVLLVQHNQEGAMGLVLNRPLDLTIKAAWEQVSDSPCECDQHIHHGGPCEGPLMVVHTDPTVSEIQIAPGLHFTTEKAAVEQLIADNATVMKFFVGYAGWSAGQLEAEMEDGGWMLAPASHENVLGPDDELWDTVLTQVQQPSIYKNLNPKVIPPDPSMN